MSDAVHLHIRVTFPRRYENKTRLLPMLPTTLMTMTTVLSTRFCAARPLRAPHAMLCTERPPASEMVNRLNPVTLAYLGDSVFEMSVRNRLLWPPVKVNELSSRVQRVVCAEGQHALLEHVKANFGLTEEEEDWLRRGRNASSRGPRRLDPKVYRASTAFECLIGYLHLTDPERCSDLLEFVLERCSAIADAEG